MVDVGSGLERWDVGSLHAQQREKLLQFKINTKIADEKYLRSHKEVGLLLSGFVREVLMQRPENIREFAAGSVICNQEKNVLPRHFVGPPEKDLLLEADHRVMLEDLEIPREKTLSFLSGYFTNPDLPKKIQKQMTEKGNQAV